MHRLSIRKGVDARGFALEKGEVSQPFERRTKICPLLGFYSLCTPEKPSENPFWFLKNSHRRIFEEPGDEGGGGFCENPLLPHN